MNLRDNSIDLVSFNKLFTEYHERFVRFAYTYVDKAQWEAKAKDLAGRFVKNFEKYATNAEGKALIAAGPKA